MTGPGRTVAIVGAAATPVGKLVNPQAPDDQLEHTILARVCVNALADAGIAPADVDSATFTQPPPSCKQLGFATFMAALLGFRLKGSLSEVVQMGLTGSLAFDQAMADVALGRADVAVALGVAISSNANRALMADVSSRTVGDVDFQAPFGVTPISWYALDAARYMYETGATREQLAAVAVKSRQAAKNNPLAQYTGNLTIEDVLAAPQVVSPLGLFDVPPVGDGAICLVLASEDIARASGKPYVTVKGRGFGHDGQHQIGDTAGDITAFTAATEGADRAMTEASITLRDIDVFELYAPCTITEILVSEALGLYARGEGARAAVAGHTAIGGKTPINTSGGCLSRGHPPSLTGMYGLLELREQLLERAGARQVCGARIGLHAAELGNYNAALIHILERQA